MTKAAIIIERADVSLGGAERSIYELAGQLSAFDVDVKLLCAVGDFKSTKALALCGNDTKQRPSFEDFAGAVKNHIATANYDIIHSTVPFDFIDIYQPRGGSYKEAMIQNCASYSNRVVSKFKLLTNLANKRRTRYINAEEQLCTQNKDFIIAAISNYVKEQFITHYNFALDRITVIPNGVKTDRPVNDISAEQLRTKILVELDMREAQNPVIALFAANNFRLKGLRPLLEALSLAKGSELDRPICLAVAGTGPIFKYKQIARKLGVADRVVFLDKVAKIQNAISTCDLAVLPTYYDPCSRFILEALAADKPVITTKFNGASERYRHKVHGFIIDSPDDIDSLGQSLIYLTKTTHLGTMSNAIKDDNIANEVSIQKHAKQIVELYNRLIEKKGNK